MQTKDAIMTDADRTHLEKFASGYAADWYFIMETQKVVQRLLEEHHTLLAQTEQLHQRLLDLELKTKTGAPLNNETL